MEDPVTLFLNFVVINLGIYWGGNIFSKIFDFAGETFLPTRLLILALLFLYVVVCGAFLKIGFPTHI